MERYFTNGNNFLFFTLLIFTSLFAISIEAKNITYKLPNSLTLLDNTNVLLTSDGIHFFDQAMESEDTNKNISFSSALDVSKIAMAQFPNDLGGYILILANKIFYIFDNDKNLVKSEEITDNNINNGLNYHLIPYKNDDNKLHIIFSYVNNYYSTDFNLVYFINDLNDNNSNLTFYLTKSYVIPNQYRQIAYGAPCLLMSSISSLNINNKLITCFCFIRTAPLQILSTTFNPEDNLTEIEDLRSYSNSSYLSENLYSISSSTDQNKAIVYLVYSYYNVWCTFDFTNRFSSLNVENIGNSYVFQYGCHLHNIHYFEQTKEFVVFSALGNGCNKFIMIFHSNYTISQIGGLFFTNGEPCWSTQSFTLFYNGNDYSILTDGGDNLISFFKPSNELVYMNITETLTDTPTTIDTTYIETDTPTTIPTTYIETENTEKEINENYLGDIKCKTSSVESAIYNLCVSCNIEQQYFPASFPKDEFLHGFIECYNISTKPINFYFDDDEQKYKPCFETCLTCNEGGNGDINNCINCEINFIKKPEAPDSTNCVTECLYSYYYTSFGQYKCSNSSNCPEEANLYIKELRKCTDDCSKEGKYQYQYGGQCFENCPEDTSSNENKICIDIVLNSCVKSETEIDLQEFLTSGGVDFNAKNYAKEFGYTIKHVSHYYNNIYSILLYKDKDCIEELSIDMPKIDFGDCYTKIQGSLDPPSTDKLIISLVERSNGQKKPTTSYSFYHPETGEKIDAEAKCKDEEIIVKESVLSQLNNTNIDLDSILHLTKQDINVFNLSDAFYNDICYHFDSPNGKDAPLQDRIKAYYPNITLCDSGCTSKGVNLTTLESICVCTFNDIMSNELIEENALIQNTIGEVVDILSSSNLLVLKCYEDVFKIEYIKKGTGGFIVIAIVFTQIAFSFVFILYDMSVIRKYLYNLSQYFVIYISNGNKELLKNTHLITNNQKAKQPPKKKKSHKNIIQNHISSKNNKKASKKNIINDENYSKSLNSVKSTVFMSGRKGTKFQKTNLLRSSKKLDNDKDALTKLIKAKKSCGDIDIEEYLKPDFDDMEYDDAIKLDKRTFCEYFIEKLKQKQIIMDTFFNKENLIPMAIKIILLALNIDLYFVINGFFFNEEYLSELFNSDEEETFFSFIPRSITRFFYTTAVGIIISVIIDCIFIEENKIRRIFLREKDDIMQLKYEISVVAKSIKKRYTIFIFLCLFISIISWYYISCFNNTYPYVKMEWIKSSIAIIIIMNILSIIVALLDSIFRSLSFHYKSETLYKIKKFIS